MTPPATNGLATGLKKFPDAFWLSDVVGVPIAVDKTSDDLLQTRRDPPSDGEVAPAFHVRK